MASREVIDNLVAALSLYECAFEELFVQCGSNGLRDVWNRPASCEKLNNAHERARAALTRYYLEKPMPEPINYEKLLSNIEEVIAKQKERFGQVQEGNQWIRDLEAAASIIRILVMVDRAEAEENHPDNLAVKYLAHAMKAKLAKKRAEGMSLWNDPNRCSTADLARLLRHHVQKGDPVDVANYAAMLYARNGKTNEGME